MKRFYKSVGIEEADGRFQVTLDGRGIKTARGAPQSVPNRALAEALASEWEAQGEELDPRTFQARDLLDYAIDVVAADPASVAEKVLGYGDTDTLLYRADPDMPLFARQQEVWEPIVTEFERREGVTLVRVSGIVHRPQPDATLAHLRERLLAQNAVTLAATELMTSLSASLVTGLSALECEDQGAAEQLWQAASLEEEWQADLWGRDEEAEQVRARRKADFLTAHKLARLSFRA